MCGRYTLSSDTRKLGPRFGVEAMDLPDWLPRYNIAPSQPVLAVVRTAEGRREMKMLRWGLIPSWSREPGGNAPINARAETVDTKPTFRDAFLSQRCLLPADGFYEWRRVDRQRQPYLIRMKDRQPFALAGLWSEWQGPGGEVIETCAILTTDANELVRPIHDRMPVIFRDDAFDRWLDPSTEVASLKAMLRPIDAPLMEAFPVSRRINSPGWDAPGCSEPVQEQNDDEATLF